jgi:hypothetical protein
MAAVFEKRNQTSFASELVLVWQVKGARDWVAPTVVPGKVVAASKLMGLVQLSLEGGGIVPEAFSNTKKLLTTPL